MSKATTAERALNRKGGTMSRLIKTLFGFYPVLLPLVVVGVVLCAIINSIGATFLQSALQIISESWQSGDWTTAQPKILQLVTTLACIYGVGILSSLFWNRAMAIVTQGSLEKLREMMFNRMQDLPIRYFDTHQRGDIMSHYTNDIDTLRQMISQSLPNLLMTIIIIVTVFFIMLYYSVWMCLVIVAGVAFMTFMTKLLGSNSARFFIAQQAELGVVEGHIEEVMNGQKVVKAFCHESAAEADFDERNEKLFEVSQKANMYANILMPILMNLGNLLYVLVALAGGIFLALGVPNLSISGMALSIAVVVPFLNMTKQFCGQIGQISQQINAVVMGLAGADRIFELIDEEPEADEGYVTLVNAQVNPDTWQLEEADHHTGMWAWKHPHRATGEIEYVPLRGDLVMDNVDFGYTPDHEVLHGVSVFAKPGQKVAFVGATGAGKTTITNLINRFYDIADGKIRYDGINVNKIRKADLRRMDNRNKRVDISNLVDFHPVAPDHEFSPLLVNPNLNIELSSFSETFEELMSFPNYPEFAEEFAAKLDRLYIADGYSEETNINNMIVQLLILEGYISSDDLAQGSVIEKVNRETIAAAKHAVVQYLNRQRSERAAEQPRTAAKKTPEKSKQERNK